MVYFQEIWLILVCNKSWNQSQSTSNLVQIQFHKDAIKVTTLNIQRFSNVQMYNLLTWLCSRAQSGQCWWAVVWHWLFGCINCWAVALMFSICFRRIPNLLHQKVGVWKRHVYLHLSSLKWSSNGVRRNEVTCSWLMSLWVRVPPFQHVITFGFLSVCGCRNNGLPNCVCTPQPGIFAEWASRGSSSGRNASAICSPRMAHCILHASSCSGEAGHGPRCKGHVEGGLRVGCKETKHVE